MTPLHCFQAYLCVWAAAALVAWRMLTAPNVRAAALPEALR